MLKIGHVVVRPGKMIGDPQVRIPVPEELETVPGIPTNNREVDWYSREEPLETMNITQRAARHWYDVQTEDDEERHNVGRARQALLRPLEEAIHRIGDLEPTDEPNGKDVSDKIKQKARALGFVEVGIVAYDHRYTFQSKKRSVKFPHAICLVYEENFAATQTIPSVANLEGRLETSPTNAANTLELGNYIRSLGYRAQIVNTNFGVVIPMFVEAGIGQMGACGYLLTPHVGNRCRLQMIVTDAKVTYDKPVDYGIHAFCQVCQVCVNRCPGRALMRDKIWYRGVEKNKLQFRRCRPVMARYLGCGVCMKVCPIQKYGMKNVLEHYAATGQVLGKGSHDLEGYTLGMEGGTTQYFGPGELPRFAAGFFDEMPKGTARQYAFEQFTEKARQDGGVISDELLKEFQQEITRALKVDALEADATMAMATEDEV